MSLTDLDPLRFSRLKAMSKSAMHYEAKIEFDSSPIKKGSALHTYMLGDPSRVVVYTGGARNKKHKKYQAFMEEHPDQLIMSPKEMVDVEGMRRSLEKHKRAMDLLDGVQEERITWTLCGRECAGTPDVVKLKPGGRKRLTELKSGVTAAPDLFKWHAKKMAYHGQIGWYADGLELSTAYAPGPVDEQFIVVVESTRPYPVTVIRVTDKMRKKGARQCRMWLEQLLVCERTGHFPGYVEADVDWDDDELEWDAEEEAA